MKRTIRTRGTHVAGIAAIGILSIVGIGLPLSAAADDTPSPCAALKRIVSAAPEKFSTLGPSDGTAVARPYGSDASCTNSPDAYQCQWSSNPGAGSVADALQAVAADIASCLPDATHDQNTPGLQHFYIGPKGSRTQISATTAGGTKLKIVVSGQ